MEFDLVLKKRRMVRSFSERQVDDAQIAKLLRNAHRTPSGGFLQQQEFIVIRNKKTKEKLAEAAVGQDFIAQVTIHQPKRNNQTKQPMMEQNQVLPDIRLFIWEDCNNRSWIFEDLLKITVRSRSCEQKFV